MNGRMLNEKIVDAVGCLLELKMSGGQRLKDKGYTIGTVCAAYVSKTTPTGNVAEITVKDTAGKTVKLTKEACRWTLDAKSMRFTISGGGGGGSW